MRKRMLALMSMWVPWLFLAAVATAQPPGLGDLAGLGADPSIEGVVQATAVFSLGAAGQPARLTVTATIKPGWHIYATTQKGDGPIPTSIALDPSEAFKLAGEFTATTPPKEKHDATFNLMVQSHEGEASWWAPVELAAGIDPAQVNITGILRVQPCTESSCMPPTKIPFTAALVGGLAPSPPTAGAVAGSLPLHMLLGFLGGLILNLMPCVLPVIGLKILAFVEQSGHDRARAFMLNVWYSLGLLAVFMVLAGLAAFVGMGWGQLFSFQGFNVALAVIVFAMALSFLGVWEIPIPGFVGHGAAADLARHEGAGGAFAKGVLTTLLATPCSAPFLGTALAWTLQQPPAKTFAVFFATGLGMASPYLVIGAAPELLRFLPKPGMWMETFKQLMGFVLLATVVFVLSFMPFPAIVPSVALMFGVWAACWWIGRAQLAAEGSRARAWIEATAFAALVAVLVYPWLGRVMEERFARAGSTYTVTRADGSAVSTRDTLRRTIEQLAGEGKTVLVDFTADWCLTCKTLEKVVLQSEAVTRKIADNGVVLLRADWTHAAADVTEMLERLQSKQVPVIAVYAAGQPTEPVAVMRGSYTQQELLDALDKAGPSRGERAATGNRADADANVRR